MRTFRLAFAQAPRWVAVWCAIVVVQAALPPALVATTRFLVDGLISATQGGPAAPIYVYGGLFAGLLVLQRGMAALTQFVQTMLTEHLRDATQAIVHEQAVLMDLAYFESSKYFDELHRARTDATGAPAQLVVQGGRLVQGALSLVGVLIVLSPFGIWPTLAVLAGAVPAALLTRAHAKRFNEWRVEKTFDERFARYREFLMTMREAAPEVRVLGLGPRLRDGFNSLRAKLRGQRLSLERRQLLQRLAINVWMLAILGALMLWVVREALAGRATVGEVAMFFTAFAQAQAVSNTVTEGSGQAFRSLLMMDCLFALLDRRPRLPPDAGTKQLGAVRGHVRFEAVQFHYPETDRPAVDGVDLDIRPGTTVALVGYNGAGKSTLLKLLCRLYDPDRGRVLIDGIDLRDVAPKDVWQHVSAMFQHPTRYEATLAGNIDIGDVRRELDETEIRQALADAGGEGVIDKIPGGLQGRLGRQFDGHDLSGGEWQRIALARAYVRRDAPILVLDEPTSAMDAWAEADWVERFHQLAKGRTTLLITHRFLTAKHADVIHVMEHGRIVESGTHQQLLAAGGRYAQAWAQQMRETEAEEVP